MEIFTTTCNYYRTLKISKLDGCLCLSRSCGNNAKDSLVKKSQIKFHTLRNLDPQTYAREPRLPESADHKLGTADRK